MRALRVGGGVTNPDSFATLIAETARRRGVSATALLAMMSDVVKRSTALPPDALKALLERKADDFLALRARLNAHSADETESRRRAAATAALDAGRFGDLDKALAQRELALLGDLANLAALSAERRQAAAELRADRAATSFLRTAPEGYQEAAQRYSEASALMGLADLPRSRELAVAQVDALARISIDFGGRDGFDAAVAQARRLIDGLDGLVEPVAYAAAQAALADALARLADLTGDGGMRAEALAACRAGLEDLRREDAPGLWRGLQGSFGLLALAVGESGQDEDLLEEAVTALAAALAAWNRDLDGPGWIELEFAIARARAVLGGRRGDLALLERAFNSFNRISATVERAGEPLRWAALQDEMGQVLRAMGERYSEPVVLEEAIAAFGLALEERRRETQPLLWATSSANQGFATLKLAERQKDMGLAQQGLTLVMAAIEAMRASGFPANAATLQKHLVEASARLGAMKAR
jgi:hypothetical protein